MEVVGLTLAIPCGIGILMTLGGWLLKIPPLKWVGLAVTVVACIAVSMLCLFDEVDAGFGTRKQHILRSLTVSGPYLLGGIIVAIIAVIGVPCLIIWVIVWLIRKCWLLSQGKVENAT